MPVQLLSSCLFILPYDYVSRLLFAFDTGSIVFEGHWFPPQTFWCSLFPSDVSVISKQQYFRCFCSYHSRSVQWEMQYCIIYDRSTVYATNMMVLEMQYELMHDIFTENPNTVYSTFFRNFLHTISDTIYSTWICLKHG